MKRSYVPLFIIAVIFWIVMTLFWGPTISGTDVFIFKDAGVNWALGHGFKSMGIPGNFSSQLKDYGSYPPTFPFLFGIYTRLTGLGAYQNAFFSLLIAVLTTWLFLLLLEQKSPEGE